MAEIKVYTLDEVAAILKVTRRTLYNYISWGKLKVIKMGKCRRVSQEALQSFVSTGTEAVDANSRKENQHQL